MPAFKKITIDGPNFFLEILKPSFGDLITDSDVMNGFFGEFIVLDDVKDKRKIVDITPISNILKRRDASCAIEFEPVGKAGTREIAVTDLYGATEFCATEFYQGCLKDWRNGDPTFITKIYDFFRKAIRRDLISNMYFGDVSRVDANGAKWSTRLFDGIYTMYIKYVANGKIPAAQTFNIPNAIISPANSAVYLENLYAKQDEMMELLDDSEKAIYLDKDWYSAYESYLLTTGVGESDATNYIQDGIKTRAYKGIPIFVNKVFKPTLKQIVGANAHFGILTLRGNFMFATDKEYGEGPNLNIALNIWYDWNTLQFKWAYFVKAGTNIALPEHSVLGLPS